jgi:hypothetical protein
MPTSLYMIALDAETVEYGCKTRGGKLPFVRINKPQPLVLIPLTKILTDSILVG